MHIFRTCVWRTAAQWQNPIFPTSKLVFFLGFCHRAAVLQTQVQKLCTALDLGLLYILILGTYSKFARKNNFQALGVCIPHDRALAAGLPRHDHVNSTTDESFRFHNKKSMKYVVNWIPLRIRVRPRNTQPHLKVKSTTISRFERAPL